MSDWHKTCEEIIAAGTKATVRPWYECSDFAGEAWGGGVLFTNPANEEYTLLAANNADRLARMVKTLTDKLRDGFDDGDRADAEVLRSMDKRLDHLWEQSK